MTLIQLLRHAGELCYRMQPDEGLGLVDASPSVRCDAEQCRRCPRSGRQAAEGFSVQRYEDDNICEYGVWLPEAPDGTTLGGPNVRNLMWCHGDWYVVGVNSKCERKLSEWLRTRAFGHYLPVTSTRVRAGRNLVPGVKMVLPGFVFCRLELEDMYLVRGRREVHRCERPIQQSRFGEQLALLETTIAITKGIGVVWTKDGANLGVHVRVIPGHPLAGMSGHVELVKSRIGGGPDIGCRRVVVGMEFGMAYAFEVLDKDLEVVPDDHNACVKGR